MGKKVIHFEVLGKDGKKLQDFYSKLFEWKINADNPMNYGVITPEDAGVGGGVSGGPPDGGDGHVTFYVEVEDLNEYLKKAESLGGKTIMPPMDVPGGPQLAMLADPEGHVIGMVKAGTMA